MQLPDPKTIDPVELAANLRGATMPMIERDGDRDGMNSSRLLCEETQLAFRLMLIAADKLEAMSSIDGQ